MAIYKDLSFINYKSKVVISKILDHLINEGYRNPKFVRIRDGFLFQSDIGSGVTNIIGINFDRNIIYINGGEDLVIFLENLDVREDTINEILNI